MQERQDKLDYETIISLEKNLACLKENNERMLRNFGENIDLNMLRLLFVAIQKEKDFFLEQTIIDLNQIDEYLKILKLAPNPVNEIVSIRNSGHWFCASLQIQEKKIKLLIIDSLGWKQSRWTGAKDLLTRAISNTFSKHKFTCYIIRSQRQKDYYTCSIFVLIDVMDLLKSPEIFQKCTADHGKSLERPDYSIEIFETKLPSKMLRMNQVKSLTFFQENYAGNNPENLVNKKNQTLAEYIHSNSRVPQPGDLKFFPEKEYTEADRYNFSASDKLKKTYKKVMDCLQESSEEDIVNRMNQYSLFGLHNRLILRFSDFDRFSDFSEPITKIV